MPSRDVTYGKTAKFFSQCTNCMVHVGGFWRIPGAPGQGERLFEASLWTFLRPYHCKQRHRWNHQVCEALNKIKVLCIEPCRDRPGILESLESDMMERSWIVHELLSAGFLIFNLSFKIWIAFHISRPPNAKLYLVIVPVSLDNGLYWTYRTLFPICPFSYWAGHSII